jgi:hypothetical protein
LLSELVSLEKELEDLDREFEALQLKEGWLIHEEVVLLKRWKQHTSFYQ